MIVATRCAHDARTTRAVPGVARTIARGFAPWAVVLCLTAIAGCAEPAPEVSNEPIDRPSFVPASATNVLEEADPATGVLRLRFEAPEADLLAMVDSMPALTQQYGRATRPGEDGEAPDVAMYAARSDTGLPLCVFVHWDSLLAMVWNCPEAMIAEEEAGR